VGNNFTGSSVFQAPGPSKADSHVWAGELEDVTERLRTRFGRTEPRRRAAAYLAGLLSTAERENRWQLTDALPEEEEEHRRRVIEAC
jgi:hypothetical protein